MGSPIRFYCSDEALKEMIDSPYIPEDRKVELREEKRQRALPTIQELIDELWGHDDDQLVENDEWDGRDKLWRVHDIVQKYDERKRE